MSVDTVAVPARRGAVVGWERVAWIAAGVGAGLLGLVGFALSFARVSEEMRPHFGDLAPAVPLAVDLGILVFTVLDLLMAYRGIRTTWLRFVPWGLVAVTAYLNVVGAPALEARVAHAALPALWVIAVEVGAGAVRAIAGIRGDARKARRLDRIRSSRWLLAPLATARMWRRMVLLEETSLADAADRSFAIRLARADLRDRYGPLAWHWQATRRERLYYRAGRVAPADPGPPPGSVLTAPTGPVRPGPVGGGPVPVLGAPGTNGDRSRGTVPTLDEGTVAAGRSAAEALEDRGDRLTRSALIAEMRDRGHTISTTRATALLQRLRAPA